MRRIFTVSLLFFLLFHCRLSAQVQAVSIVDTLSGCAPQTVNFRDISTGSPTDICWDFDDGSSPVCNGPNPTTRIYTQPGVYNVRHFVSDGNSSDTEYILIRVYRGPEADFESIDLVGCAPHCAYFNNRTIVGESALKEFIWDYEDPSPTDNYNGYHCYAQGGTYQVSLFVKDFNGCESKKVVDNYITVHPRPRVSLTANPALSCTAPRIVQLTATITSPTVAGYRYRFFTIGNGVTYTDVNTPSLTATVNYLYPNGIYNAFVEVTDGRGCKDTSFFRIEITDLVADFDATPDTGCAGTPVQFTDLSNFSSGWIWSWGDGTPDTTTRKNPVYTYQNPGCYDVRLIIRYNLCRDTILKPDFICIYPAPDFTFTANQTYNCTAPFTVNFTASLISGVISNYAWNFGDGSPVVNTTGTSASHTYTSEGNRTVSVTATSIEGCTKTVSLPNYIRIKDINAGFTVSIDSGCAPLSVRFTNNTTGQGPFTYQWIFGDGDTASALSPTHIFNNTGNFKPILIVTNSSGCKDTFTFPRIIKVGAPVLPTFTADPLIQCVNQTVTFYNTTNIAGITPPPTFIWYYEGPNAGGTGPGPFRPSQTHFYTDTGCFDIRLTIISQGCRADTTLDKYVCIVVPIAKFDFTTNCANTLMDTFKSKAEGADLYSWDFGNGPTPFSDSDSIYVYQFPAAGTYSVLHIVRNNSTGCVDSIRKTVTVGISNAGFRADTLSGCYPLTVRFTDTSQFANSWRWNFGDTASGTTNNTSSSRNPSHTFRNADSYTITLTINPNSGCPESVSRVAYINVYGANAWFETIPPAGCIPFNTTLRDSSRSFMGTVNSWTWNFGDPGSGALNNSIIQNPSHRYDSMGNYTVRLTVTDTRGCQHTATRIVRAVKTTAAFTADTAVCPGDDVLFTNLSAYANNYFWNFGDPGSPNDTSRFENPTHRYPNTGFYTITLVAVNDTFGCSDTLRRNINISLPVVDFYDTSGFAPCPPFPVRFFNVSSLRPGFKFLWDFGDGRTDSLNYEPIHVFFFPGDYDVSLTLSDTNGTCVVTRRYEDLIRIRGPIGRFVASTDTGCKPLTVCISGTLQTTFSMVADMGNGVVFPFDNLYGQPTAPNVCYTYDSAGTYYPVYILRDSLNCTVAYPVDTILVGIIPYPDLQRDTTVCEGNYVQFSLPYGSNFVWRSLPTPSYLSCENCANPVSSAPDTITYYVTAISDIGCSARDTITINVDPLPDVFPGLYFRICSGDTLQLSAGTGVSSAVWSPPLYIDDTLAVNPKVWPPDTMTYRVTAFNRSGCSISRIVYVYPIGNVVGTVSPRDTVVCEGESVQFQAQVLEASINDTSIKWSPSNYLNSPFIFNPVLHAPAGNHTYTVNISSSTCVPYIDSVHVYVSPNPNLQAGDNVTVTEGTTVNLWASSAATVTYNWTPTIDSLSCITCRMPTFIPTQSQYVYVEVTNQYGCTARDSVYIRVVACDESIVFVPNTFTPNNDNRNDVLYVRGAGLQQLNFFRIFDRWGQLVWETDEIGEGWDGTIRGQVANTATFVYVLEAVCSNGLLIEKKGNVTLVR